MGGGGGGARRFSKLSEPTRPLVAWGSLGAAAAGLVMTLPAVTLTYPTADHLDHMLPLRVLYLVDAAARDACMRAARSPVCAGLISRPTPRRTSSIGGKNTRSC